MNPKNNEQKVILVVEDSQVVQNITKHVLEFYNHRVITALDGKEALQKVKENDIDAILMDLAMPNMNGIECVSRIRSMSDKNKSTVSIIAVTGNAEFYTAIEFEKAGFDAFVEKPIDFDGMSKILKKFI